LHPTLIMENENQDLMDRYLSTIHELNHEKIRRQGFERELDIQKGIVDSFAGNLIRIGNECRDHALEVKRLKAESVKDAAQLWEQSNEIKRLNSLIANSEHELAQLNSDTARLKNNTGYLDRKLDEEIACVERLIKAGDELAEQLHKRGASYEIGFAIQQWQIAKGTEGQEEEQS